MPRLTQLSEGQHLEANADLLDPKVHAPTYCLLDSKADFLLENNALLVSWKLKILGHMFR